MTAQSTGDVVPERWNAVGPKSDVWMDPAQDPRFATGTELEGERATLLDYLRAYRLLAYLQLPGEDYQQLLARLHAHLAPATYLEIGIDQGHSFRLLRPGTRAIGVDPAARLAHALAPGQSVFAMTSDEFFTRIDVRAALGGASVRMAFIDGMHHFEFALRDFVNLEPLCERDSVVLMHDCYPLDARTASR